MVTRRRTPAAPPLVAAVKRELKALEARGAAVKGAVEAELALTLAAAIADPATSLRDATAAARGLADAMAALRAIAPAEQTSDALDELAAQREKRRAS